MKVQLILGLSDMCSSGVDISYSVVQFGIHNALQCTLQCSAVQCSAVQCSVVKFRTVQCSLKCSVCRL